MVKHMLECNPKSKSKSKFKIQETKININKANMNGLVVKSLSNMHKVLHAHLIATDILKKKINKFNIFFDIFINRFNVQPRYHSATKEQESENACTAQLLQDFSH